MFTSLMTNKLGSYQDVEDETQSGGAFDSKGTQIVCMCSMCRCMYLNTIWSKATATSEHV